MNELAKWRIRLAELEHEAAEKDLRIDLLMSDVRERLDPFIDNPLLIRIDEAALAFNRLVSEIAELRALKIKIDEIKKALL